MADSAKEMIWLVKSGERIIGPFYESALIQKLYEREIVVIDEVAKPGGRWHYLREEAAFKSAVEELWRRNQGLREDTDIATISNSEKTLTTIPSAMEQLVKPEKRPSAPDSRSGSRGDPRPDSRSDSNSVLPDIPRPAEFDQVHNDLGRSSNKPAAKEGSSRPLWVAAICVLAIAAYVLSKPRQQTALATKAPAFDQLSAQALRAEKTGRFTEALRMLREAHQIRAEDAALNLRLATLMVKVEHQTVDAKRLATETMDAPKDASLREPAQIVLGLAALADHDPVEADKQFAGALAANRTSSIAQFDVGMAAFDEKKWDEALKAFETGVRDQMLHVPATFMLARAQMKTNEVIEARKHLGEIIEAGVNAPLRQEAQLLLASLDKTEEAAAAVLKIDPFYTDETYLNPLIATGGMEWKSFGEECEALTMIEGATGSSLRALCELKTDHKSEATKTISDAIAKEPSNTTLLTTNATIFLSFGKDEEAKGALKLAMREEAAPIVLNLMARACSESQDAVCEREHWRKLLEREPMSVAAFTGLAKLEYQAGSESESKSWLEKAWRISSSYIPLLQLQDEFESRKQ